MKNLLLSLSFTLLFAGLSYTQTTINDSTLPEIGDQLIYTNFNVDSSINDYKNQGENLTWEYSNLNLLNDQTENYEDINGHNLQDKFPNANMVLNVFGFDAAANRMTQSIEILGLDIPEFAGIPVNSNVIFDEPFTLRSTPFGYGDIIEDSYQFQLTFGSDLIPGIDTLTIPGINVQIDSIRSTTTIHKVEEGTAWGTLNLEGNEYDVLKVKQDDITSSTIEVGFEVFGQFTWLDASLFLQDFFEMLNQTSTTYKFLTNDSKTSLIEFTEIQLPDTIGGGQVNVVARVSKNLPSSLNYSLTQNDVNIYPNPAQDFLFIKGIESPKSNTNWTIYNSSGKEVSEGYFNEDGLIDISSLSSGHYFIKIQDGNATTKNLKFVVE